MPLTLATLTIVAHLGQRVLQAEERAAGVDRHHTVELRLLELGKLGGQTRQTGGVHPPRPPRPRRPLPP
jgi:hypothetical protein